MNVYLSGQFACALHMACFAAMEVGLTSSRKGAWFVGEGLHQKDDAFSDDKRPMSALELCFGSC